MAKNTYAVVYLVDNSPTEKKVRADYFEEDDGFVTFSEEADSSTGAGGVVFSVNTDWLLMVERIAPREM